MFPDVHVGAWTERKDALAREEVERVCDRARRRQRLLDDAEERAVRALRAAAEHAREIREDEERARRAARLVLGHARRASQPAGTRAELWTILGCVLGGTGVALSVLALLVSWANAG